LFQDGEENFADVGGAAKLLFVLSFNHEQEKRRRFDDKPEQFGVALVGIFAVIELDQISLARAQRGDRAAFRSLVNAYQRPVHALIGRMLSSRSRHAEVDDLAQETFMRVYRALPDFESRGPGRLSKWILTIAARLALDELRRVRAVPVGSEQSERVASHEHTDSSVHRKAIAQAISSAVSSLTPDQRTVFLLREYHDFDYQDIASALDIDIGTVKSRLSRARTALQLSLHEVRHG
jgi:RNA polymerase sigma-70 factor, ECF subfamily